MRLRQLALGAVCLCTLGLSGCFFSEYEVFPLSGGEPAPFDVVQPLVCIQYDTKGEDVKKELDRPVLRFVPYTTNGELQYAVVTDEWEAFGGLATFHKIKDDIYVLVFADEDGSGEYIFIARADANRLRMFDQDPVVAKAESEKYGFTYDRLGRLNDQGTPEKQREFIVEIATGDLSGAPVEFDCLRRMTAEEAEAEKNRVLEEIKKGI